MKAVASRRAHNALLWMCVAASSSLMAQAPAPNAQALSQVNSSITTSVRAGVVYGPALRSSLEVRSKLMMDVLRNQPASARSYALDSATRSAIVTADPDAVSLLEQDATVTGELVQSVADDFERGTSKSIYNLHTFAHDYDLSFASTIAGVDRTAHQQVTVHGIGLENLVAVESMGMATPDEVKQCSQAASLTANIPGAGASAAPAQCSTTGIQRIAVLIVTFPGNTPAFAPGTDQAAYWDKVLFGANPSVNGFWNEVSYGQTSATGDVFGPFALSQAYDCNSTSAMQSAAITAAAGTVDFSQYNRIMIVFPVSTCYFGGLANVGCVSGSTTINHQYSVVWMPISSWYAADNVNPQMWGASAHELGHNLGMGHANTLDFGSAALGPLDFAATNPGTVQPGPPPQEEAGAAVPVSAVNTEYGDRFASMGYPWNGSGPYSAEHRANILRWIPSTDERAVTGPGSYTLVPAENSSGLRALRVLRDPISSSWVWLEFHQATGYYTPNNIAAQGTNTLTSGAQLHYETGSMDPLHTYLLDMTPVAVTNNFRDGTLAPGQSWADPYSLLNISVANQTTSSLGVTVSYDTPCATVSLSASELAAAGGTANLNITAPSTCSWNVSSNASWISFPGTTSGSGNAAIAFTYDANTTTAQRNSYITAQRQSLPVVQDGPKVTIVGASPVAGSGSTQSFEITLVDSAGLSDLQHIEMFFGNVLGYPTVGPCTVYAQLYASNGTENAMLYLYNDSVTSLLGGFALGSAGSVSNSSCTLHGQGSSIATHGNQMTLTLNLDFLPAFAGTYPMKVDVSSSGGNYVGPLPVGIYTVTGETAASEPTISPSGGTYTSAQTVTIADATPGATIYYTTDDSAPTTSSTQYAGPITVSQSLTVKAIATATGYAQSPMASATYTINLPAAAPPMISPAGGSFITAQTVTITDTTAGAQIYYTTDGSTPTTSSSKYTAPLPVPSSETIKAIATATGYVTSTVATAQFTILLGTVTNLASSSSSIVYGTSVTLTGTVTPSAGSGVPTGSAKFYDGASLVATVALNNGTAAYTSSLFAVGPHGFIANYGGDATYATSTSASVSVTVNPPPKVTPAVTVTPSAPSITTAQALTVTVTVNGGSSYPTATGTVTLSSGSYTSAAITLNNGSATINVAAGALAVGADTLSAQYAPDSASSVYLNGATGSAAVTVTLTPGFTIAGTNVSLARGATTGNTSAITVTPVGGFSGSVALTAAITASPSAAQYPPTLSFGATTPATISGTSPANATLTISTTAATSSALEYPAGPGARWYSRAGMSLAVVLLFWIPARRRNWRALLGMVALGFVLAGGVLACGGGGSNNNGGGRSGIAGTTPGTYTITVTGAAGAISQTGTVTLTVQ